MDKTRGISSIITSVTKPSLPPIDDMYNLLERIWESKNLTNGAYYHKLFEIKLADYLDVPFVSLYVNATVGLIAALRAYDIEGEVITTPYSFVATAHAISWNNLKPVFVDIDRNTFNINPDLIEAAITEKTSAILAVHCYGIPADVEKIESLAQKYKLRVIYDAAHAFGVRCHCGSILTHGDLSVVSFHATKVFNTFEGGAVICKDAETKSKLDSLKNFGIKSETSIPSIGINGKMNEFCSALGVLQLEHIDRYIAERRLIDSLYRKELAGINGIEVYVMPDVAQHNYSYFTILIGENYKISRDNLYERLLEKGVHSRRYFYPLITSLKPYQNLKIDHKNILSDAYAVSENVLCLPIYPDLESEEVIRISNIIREFGR
ncbi:DegT/DnrJ/EryC1/StrS family aminotransferase [bacterium]|nr:DegT/DnrJ/EryC1/StrS family aminotransferase [bacterium]